MKNLIVAETFYSIQCEGRACGMPAVFLRLGGCNLLCSWCDTVEVWKKGVSTAFDQVLCIDYITRLKQGAHLVITGGEPLIHQLKLIDYIYWLQSEIGMLPFIEVETNGTIKPYTALIDLVQWWNVSPKLQNSGEPAEKRINEVAIKAFDALPGTIFKFVIVSEDDIVEILQDYDGINMTKVVLMPEGDTQEQLAITRPMVAELAIEMGLRFSDRLHITIWNQKTGV